MNKTFQFQTIVFIDTSVDNYQELFDGVIAETKPFLLDTATDGIEQIDQTLQQYPQVKTVHIISHGSPGCLYLGNSQLSLDTLERYAPKLQRWSIDNLVLYGCNIATGDGGAEFVTKLHDLTGAEIAASTTLTGAAVKGGNWELEVTTGKMQPSPGITTKVMASYPYVLNLQLEWARNIGSTGDIDNSNGIAIDSSGNVLVTGSFENSIDMDSDGTDDLLGNGNIDAYIAKFDSNGNFVFAKNIGSSGDDYGKGIATDSSGNILVTGNFENTIDIDSDGIDDLTSNGYSDSYVAKFDSDGNFVFAQNIGSSSFELGESIATDSNDNILVTGNFSNTIDIDSDGINDLSSNGSFYSDAYIAKFDSSGNLVFAQNIGSNLFEKGTGIAADSNGNVLVTGIFNANIDIDSDGIDDLIHYDDTFDDYGNFFDAYIAKFDSSGNLVFAQNISGSSFQEGRGIATDSSGNILVTGDFNNSIDIDSDGIDDLNTNGDQDAYIAKFDSSGNFVFAQNIGSSGDDYGKGIASDSSGNVWVTGTFRNTIDIDSDGIDDLTSNGNYGEFTDAYIAEFDSSGNLVFAQNIGSDADDYGRGIATDSSGNVLVTGTFWGSIDIDSDGIDDLTSNGEADIFVVKLTTDSIPTALNLSNNSIDENAAANTVIGTFSTTDDDTGDTFTYELINGTGDTDNQAFTIDGNELQINSSPDFETQSSYNIRVQTTDTGGESYQQQLTINVNDIEEAPTALNLSNNSIDENAAANTVIGTFSTTDDDTGDTFTYELIDGTGDTDNQAFTIDGDQLQINAAPDFETQSSYNIRVQTTDTGGESYQQQLTINVNDIEEAPTALNLSNNSIDENAAANTVIGTFSTTDDDTGDTFTYELVNGTGDTDNQAFTIDGNQLQINSSPDFETQSSYNIRVQTTDTGGESYQQQLTINVNDIEDEENNIFPDPENQTIIGDSGEDILNGGEGNDSIYGGGGNDQLSGSSGDDTLIGSGGQDTLIGGSGEDTLNGGISRDKLVGASGNDLLIGRRGQDILLGGPGDDILEGGIGRDRLNGGPGNDKLTGGGSIDRFIFNTNKEFQTEDVGIDEITDFSQTPGDIILLDRTTFTAINSNSGNGFSIVGEFATVTNDQLAETSDAVIVYNSNNGNLFYNPNGSAAGFDNGGQFATLTNTPSLEAEDFFLRN